jgi:mRNA interferase RelE/StbE
MIRALLEALPAAYEAAPGEARKAFDKQSRLLLHNLQRPSLRARKYDEARHLWQARVNRDWRFYFTIAGEEYHLHEIKSHPK